MVVVADLVRAPEIEEKKAAEMAKTVESGRSGGRRAIYTMWVAH